METFRACFSDVPDLRAANSVHDLVEILFIGLAAVLCGAEGGAEESRVNRGCVRFAS